MVTRPCLRRKVHLPNIASPAASEVLEEDASDEGHVQARQQGQLGRLGAAGHAEEADQVGHDDEAGRHGQRREHAAAADAEGPERVCRVDGEAGRNHEDDRPPDRGRDAEGDEGRHRRDHAELTAGGVARDQRPAPGARQVDPVDLLVGQIVQGGGVDEPAGEDHQHRREQGMGGFGRAGGGDAQRREQEYDPGDRRADEHRDDGDGAEPHLLLPHAESPKLKRMKRATTASPTRAASTIR